MTLYLMGGYCQASMAASVSENSHVDDVKEPDVTKKSIRCDFCIRHAVYPLVKCRSARFDSRVTLLPPLIYAFIPNETSHFLAEGERTAFCNPKFGCMCRDRLCLLRLFSR